eukprot:CAMPEP_0197614162 /NCGR_PEP_ID=MMETSP1326-20131121/59385_1 /TAXON_ID=1155430 /ORGANISM="Genus nov. species nov., Strain RCC2288" /LENGTH=1180 /DNA_ID=CAMNT_0043183031 /DNA_START=796 /DNA_END=4338 /DNA_ORIENTATION=-
MFKAFKEKTAELKGKVVELKEKGKEKGRRLRDNVESFTGVDKARERFAQVRNPIGGSSTAARLGGFSGAATAAATLSTAFSKIGSSPYASAAAAADAGGPRTKPSGVEGDGSGAPDPVGAAGRISGVDETDSAVAQSTTSSAADELLATLDPGYFIPENDFDPVRHVLQSLAEVHAGELTTEVLQKEEEQLSLVVEVVSTRLSKQVLDHYGDFVTGMNNITELTNNLEQSFVIVKNGRRNLSSARDNVAGALRIAESHTRKKSLLSALNLLIRVRDCQSLEAKIRASLESSSYVEAVCEYAAAVSTLRTLEGLNCAQALGQDLGSLLWDLVQKVEAVLFDICGDFQPNRYLPLFEAYLLLGEEVKPLGDKVQECYLRAVENQTEGMLRLHSLQRGGVAECDDDAAARKARMGYKELCQQLSSTQFFPCFQKTLEVLFELLCSHHRMLGWHEAHRILLMKNASLVDKHDEGLEGSEMRVSSSAAATNSSDGDGAMNISDNNNHNRYPSASSTGVDDTSGEAESLVDSKQDNRHQQEVRQRIGSCEAVIAALIRSRRAIADMAGARIAALLQASSAPSSGHFKAVLDWARAFIEAAEAFSGTQASTLRGHLERAGDRYFESLHAQRLEALRQMLDREVWVRLPEAAAQQARTDLRAAAARGGGRIAAAGGGAAVRVAQLGMGVGGVVAVIDVGGSGRFGVAAFGSVAEDGSTFASWVHKGNPFTEGATSNSGGGGAGGNVVGDTPPPPLKENNNAAEDQGQEDEEEDEEDLEVRAAYIDEGDDDDEDETMDPEVRKARREARGASAAAEASAAAGGEGDGKGLSARSPTLTASSLYLLQGVAEYLRLMRVLTPSVPVIFQGLCALFETALVRMFCAFGRHEALQPTSDQITPRLRSTLVRLTNGATLSTLMPGKGGGVGSEAWSVLSSGNLYGLKERVIALESLACIAEEFKRLRLGMKQALPPKEEQKLERFFGQTIASVEDLREHVYCHVSGLLLNLAWVPEAIGDSDKLSDKLKTGKYAKKEVSTDHNKWVDDLSTELTQFGAKLACAEVTAEALVMLWDFAIVETASAIVAGFARVRKCSPEGRAGMALDVQVLFQGNVRRLAPISGSRLDNSLRIVDTYIKAFYTPEAEMLYWTQCHPEYTSRQKVALVNQIASAYGWHSKAKNDLIASIGSDELAL